MKCEAPNAIPQERKATRAAMVLTQIGTVASLIVVIFSTMLLSSLIIDLFKLTIDYMATVILMSLAVTLVSFIGLCIHFAKSDA